MELMEFRAMGLALAIGLLIGGERYKGRSDGEKRFAGLRTFATISLLGGATGVIDQPMFTAVSFVAIAVFMGLAYMRESGESLGGTTEVAALLTFWLGYMTNQHEALAVSTAVALVIVLATKHAMHEFVSETLSEREFLDTLKFLAVVFVAWPLLPDVQIGPYAAFNPAQVWMLVILVSTISYVGYFLIRTLGSSRGLLLSSLIGGLVSTTAVTQSLAQLSRKSPQLSRMAGATGVLANSVQLPRLLLLIWIVDESLGRVMAGPLLAGFAAAAGGSWVLARIQNVWDGSTNVEMPLDNPYSFLPALKFAALLGGVLIISKGMSAEFGHSGIYVTSTVAGLADASAISLSVANLVHGGELPAMTAGWAILLATSTNAVFKTGIAALNGTRALAFWLAGGFATMVVTAALVLEFTTSG